MRLIEIEQCIATVDMNWSDLTLIIRAIAKAGERSEDKGKQLMGMYAMLYKQFFDIRRQLERGEIDENCD